MVPTLLGVAGGFGGLVMSIWDVGFAYLLKGEKDPITLKSNQTPARGLHFVDENGVTLVPLYVADAVPLPGQAPAGGFKITIPGAGAIATLQADVANANANISALDARVTTEENLEEPFLIEWDPPVFPETIAQIVIDWNATEGSRHAKVETVVADSVSLAASTNAVEGFTYTVTFSGAASDRLYDANWVAGSSGFLYPASGDPEVIVYKFVYMEGKMRQIGNHYSAP